MLEPTWGRCIEVHPQIINEKGKRWIGSSLTKGAEEAILDVPHGKPPVLTEPFHPPRTGTAPPGQQRIDITATTRQQLSRRILRLKFGAELDGLTKVGPTQQQSPGGRSLTHVALSRVGLELRRDFDKPRPSALPATSHLSHHSADLLC